MKGFIYKISNADDSIIFIGSSSKTTQAYWKDVQMKYKTWLRTGKLYSVIYDHLKNDGVESFGIVLLSEHDLANSIDIYEHKQLAINSMTCINNSEHDFRIGDAKKDYVNPKYDPRRKIQCVCGSTYSRYNEGKHLITKKHKAYISQTNMLAHELEGLKRLKIKPIKWGSSYRIKVRGWTGKMVYIGNPSHPKNQKLIAKQYKVSIADLEKNLSPDYRDDPTYKPWIGMFGETHLYENIPADEFYDKLENVLLTQNKAYKINLALGYTMYDPVSDVEFYFYPNIANTNVYDKPFVVNSRADARKVISDIRMKELSDTLNYPKSGIKVKAITGFKIFIDYRHHALCDSDALVPEFIKKNRYVINFPRTNNKCVFYCIAYHLQEEKNQRKVVAQVKEAFKRYCRYKGLTFSLSLYKGFKPIDLLEFDHLEECFKININVYSFDIDTNAVECKRPTEGKYDDTLNILSHDNHAFYITNVGRVQSKYNCPKCTMLRTESKSFYQSIQSRALITILITSSFSILKQFSSLLISSGVLIPHLTTNTFRYRSVYLTVSTMRFDALSMRNQKRWLRI
ncbi:unnamed protein product [Phytophthora lilii]|uniref:Unnamed protein product n=1 Tax=Phytophthora lilii TaxID=2077276 RepID=A0A9W6U564_9STRA|nr:unnamed protein product [Phytophthora lilii]